MHTANLPTKLAVNVHPSELLILGTLLTAALAFLSTEYAQMQWTHLTKLHRADHVRPFHIHNLNYWDTVWLQPTKSATLASYMDCFQVVMFNHIFINLPLSYLTTTCRLQARSQKASQIHGTCRNGCY